MNGAVLAIGARPDLLDRAEVSPGAPSATTSRGAGSPRLVRSRPSSSQSSLVSRIPNRTETSARSPFSVIPQAQITPSFGPLGRTGR